MLMIISEPVLLQQANKIIFVRTLWKKRIKKNMLLNVTAKQENLAKKIIFGI